MKNLFQLTVLIVAAVCMVTCDDTASADIVHPCASGIDLSCVREYFNKNGHCSVVKEAKDGITVKSNLPIFLPKIGLTVITTETYLSQLDGDIERFYVDKKSGNLVISVNFASKGIFCDAPGTILAVGRKGREPKVITEYVNATYPAVITAIIPASDGITVNSLEQAEYSTYFPHSNAPIYIGPKFTQSEDPDVKAAFEGLVADVPTALQEIFSTKAPYLFTVYLQNYICDFNLNPAIGNYDLTVFSSENGADIDDESQFSKPCDQSDDVTNCVRKYIAEQSSCAVVKQPTADPVYRDVFTNPIPWLNATIVLLDSRFTGLDGKIEEFYIDKQTDNLVMSVAFNSIRMYSSLSHLLIYQKGEEPKVISDYSEVHYPVTLTATIPIGKGLSEEALEKAFISTHFTDSPIFNIGPNFTKSKDPQIMKVIDNLRADPTTTGKEVFVNEGSYLFLSYLQKYICDFGMSLS